MYRNNLNPCERIPLIEAGILQFSDTGFQKISRGPFGVRGFACGISGSAKFPASCIVINYICIASLIFRIFLYLSKGFLR